MALAGSVTSSPVPGGFTTLQEEIAYYKTQYEHLESELQDFQASSRELEAELERDVEASEKRERTLREKVEGLKFEVDEWKTKYKQSKAEANAAQNTLQKEITTLRDTSRGLQLRLRDIEVANDDFERQARNTTSSLEDMESKYNVAIERSVMMEEEIKATEQERESLRIASQRLRDELSDLKIEAEITKEKLSNWETGGSLEYKRISQLSDSKFQTPQSPLSAKSVATTSTTAISTPPALKSEASPSASEAPTPPSPPLSETSAPAKTSPMKPKAPTKAPSARNSISTPKPPFGTMGRPKPPRSAIAANAATPTPNFARRTIPRSSMALQEGLPRSGSLYQIRGLIGKMQKLEERVHSARSKLPAPTNTPPRASPRGTVIPATVTVRSSKRRPTDMALSETSTTPSRPSDQTIRRPSHPSSRISFGGAPHDASDSRPSSRASRPSSRASISNNDTSFAHPSGRSSVMGLRPPSRQQGPAAEARRPRSSLSGRAPSSHGHRPSIGGAQFDDADASFTTPTARRTTLDRNGFGSAIPTPTTLGRRQSRQMGPPERRPPTPAHSHATSQDLGETF